MVPFTLAYFFCSHNFRFLFYIGLFPTAQFLYAAAIAACLSAALFETLKNLFSFVMSNFTSYEIIYGAFAAVPIFLLWVFLSWNIVLLGVEVSFALTAFHSGKEQKDIRF